MEKKTFKGVELGTYYPSPDKPWAWTAGSYHFPHTEWDMEVTFTRKLPPLELGDQVFYKRYSQYNAELVTVIHVHDDHFWYMDDDEEYFIGELQYVSLYDSTDS